jgi:hypothetical protein
MYSSEYQEKRLPNRTAMHDLLTKATVSLRGWPYPYFVAEETVYNGKWLEGQVNHSEYKEYLRLYESGQWIHYLSLSRAWITREELFESRSPLPPQHSGYLHIRGDILFDLTEMLRFAVGLVQNGILTSTASISIQLHNTSDYMLYEDFERPYFYIHKFVNQSEDPIEHHLSLPSDLLSTAIADQNALEMAIKVFEVFNWIPTEAGIRMLTEDQKKLIERRL